MASVPNRTPLLLDRRVADNTTDQTLREHRKVIKELYDSPMVAGRLVDVAFAAGVPQAVQHGLGRKAQGYIVTRRDDNVHVYDAAPGDSRTDVIWLQANSDLNVTLWIF